MDSTLQGKLPPDIKLYSFMEYIRAALSLCHHAWLFPFRSPDMVYPQPFDTHQVCRKCTRTRFYQFNGGGMFIPGPMFKRIINRERVS